MSTVIPDVTARLTSWLQPLLGEDVRVEGLDRVDFGHSAEMLVFTIATSTDHTDVVLRLRPDPPALLEPYDLPRQFRVLSALRDTAVRTPKVLWLEDSGDVLGRPFFVMERVPGDVYEMEAPDGPGVTDRRIRRMCVSMAEQLAAVHTVDLVATGLAELGDGHNHLDREIARWADEMHRVQRGELPALERLLAELQRSKPEQYPTVTLVHGDAKPGNFAFVGDDVSAVFDWELTSLGDPLTDLGWMELLWMQPVGLTSHPAALSIDDFLAHYQAASGITPRNRPWYRALNAFKMAVICLIGSALYDSGASDDERFLMNAHGISLLTQLGLTELGVTGTLDDGPVLPRPR
ncbi:phosphotransferase family protein [Mycolicibacterium pallens]|uniref:Phosphotransferase family protein n=1 Tax=Mycolicibacterium pallens TaxID=370524 RepID=A0ABX8VM81_9MYCO|nr:phosphotransferase family protein [Mycolicibacterium pallens]QYL17086.1 phosphotransferase family protein [Mycolicibacterium pallens]